MIGLAAPGTDDTVALVSYAIGIVVQLPFVATSLYTGPFVDALGGADLSLLVGLVVTAPAYYFWARGRGECDERFPVPRQQESPSAAEARATSPVRGRCR
ncbi:hypothetical protein [Streptomyces sp. NPDC056255]|uniref:hypothetical protein n=1 Tax=Streptomyces sp. NPDC056255 TaxID=3345764 RepID=UPI0035E10C66